MTGKALSTALALLLPCLAYSCTPHKSLYDNKDELEAVFGYRKRMNGTLGYKPSHISPLVCSSMTDQECREEDEKARLAEEKNKRLTRRLGPTTGTVRALVLLVRFPEHDISTLPSPSEFVTRCEEVKEYFRVQSFGRYNVECDVMDWAVTEESEAFYAGGNSLNVGSNLAAAFFIPILQQMDDSQPFYPWDIYDSNGDGIIDVVAAVHSGRSAERGGNTDCNPPPTTDRIRSQGHSFGGGAWVSSDFFSLGGYHITSAFDDPCEFKLNVLGVFAHEWLHTLGTIDLYDLSFSTGSLSGLGSFDIMSNSYGPGDDPALPGSPSAYSKMQTLWLTPDEIVEDGVYTIEATDLALKAYTIRTKYAENEYILIEYRRQVSYDAQQPGSGLLIYHVDESTTQDSPGHPDQEGWPENGNHFRVALLQADGLYELERGLNLGDAGDYWTQGMQLGPGPDTYPNTDSYQNGIITQTGIYITDISAPGGDTMTFRVVGLSTNDVPDEPDPLPSPTDPPSKETDSDDGAPSNNTTDPVGPPPKNTTDPVGPPPKNTTGTDTSGQDPDTSGTDPDPETVDTPAPTTVPETPSPTSAPTELTGDSGAPTSALTNVFMLLFGAALITM